MTTGGRIPVTVIGGYLGSGKTTLVNHLLRGADERIAVLVNDFGSVNIDADLIESQDGETLRLANGCICCSLAEGFAAALDTVLELDPRPDRLVLEASGVADPAAVAAYGHGPGLLLDAVVVVVDGETVRAQAADGYLAQTIDGQLRAADVLVANKLDLVPEEERADLLAWLTERNPTAVTLTAEHSRVPVEVLFGRAPTAHGGASQARDDGRGGGEAHAVDALFRSWTIERSAPMTRTEAEALVEDLPDDVVRAKGLVWLDEHPDRPAVLQLVGRRWTLRPIGTWNGPPRTQVVVIARHG